MTLVVLEITWSKGRYEAIVIRKRPLNRFRAFTFSLSTRKFLFSLHVHYLYNWAFLLIHTVHSFCLTLAFNVKHEFYRLKLHTSDIKYTQRWAKAIVTGHCIFNMCVLFELMGFLSNHWASLFRAFVVHLENQQTHWHTYHFILASTT